MPQRLRQLIFERARASRRVRLALFFSLALFGAGGPRTPTQLIFRARPGDVTFSHSQHVLRVKGDCSVCHPRLFPKDAKAPLNWKAGMHKPAEAAHTSCGACHRPGGRAFESKDNCRRCHAPEPDLN